MTIVITGASGFAGQELVSCLTGNQEHEVVAVLRRPGSGLTGQSQHLLISDLCDQAACEQIAARAGKTGVIVHLAALTPGAGHASTDFHRVNTLATGNLMRAAVAAGVPRLIYLSSTHASSTLSAGWAIDEDSPVVASAAAYGTSKLGGENALKDLAKDSQTQWTIVRAPLVYGPGAKGSLAMLARAVVRGVPLPLGSITNNARDMIGLRNLAAFLQLCAGSKRAANEVFVVRDGEPVSTRHLIEHIAQAAGRPARLVPCPPALLNAAARGLGAKAMVERLLGDHRVNDAKARHVLGWQAVQPLSFDLKRMVDALAAK